MTHWLDSVFAVPVIGLQWCPNLESCCHWSDVVGRWMNERGSEGDIVTVAHNKPLEWDLQFRSGFVCVLRPATLSVQFIHPLSIVRARPVPEISVGDVRPYTVRLEGVEQLIVGLTQELAGAKALSLVRIGIMAIADMPVEQLPPGAAGLVDHLSSPWKLGLEAMDAKLTAILEQEEEGRVRCHHMMKLNRAEGEPVAELRLDWQHLFAGPRAVSAGEVEGLIRGDVVRALEYFQAFAEGDGGNGS
jgi:hypothetical protein